MLKVLYTGLINWALKAQRAAVGSGSLESLGWRPVMERVRAKFLRIRLEISASYSPEDIYDRQGDMALLSRKMALL